MTACVTIHLHACAYEFYIQVPAIMARTISVEDLSSSLSVCGGSMVGVAVTDGEGITDLVLATVTLDGATPIGQTIRKNNAS